MFQLEVNEGLRSSLGWNELAHWICLSSMTLFFFWFRLTSPSSVLTSPAAPPLWEYWSYIRYCKRREKKEHPLHGHATSGGQQTNRRPGSPPDWAGSAWTDNDDKEMRGPRSPCPRERDGIDFSMIAHDWSATRTWFPLWWEERREAEQRMEERRKQTWVNTSHCGIDAVSVIMVRFSIVRNDLVILNTKSLSSIWRQILIITTYKESLFFITCEEIQGLIWIWVASYVTWKRRPSEQVLTLLQRETERVKSFYHKDHSRQQIQAKCLHVKFTIY